jgi:hypothetical protein
VKAATLTVNRDNLGTLAGLLESGTVRVVIDKTYPLDCTPAARLPSQSPDPALILVSSRVGAWTAQRPAGRTG